MKTLQVAAVSQETKAFWSGILIPELMSSEEKRIDEVKDENFLWSDHYLGMKAVMMHSWRN